MERIKESIKDTGVEPYARWLVKRSRRIGMPFDLVKNEIYDRQAAEVIGRVLGDTSNAIDVVCHKGQFLKLFLEYAPKGHHFAFEPIPDLAKQLQTAFPSVEVYNAALSNKSGQAAFYVIPDSPALTVSTCAPLWHPKNAGRKLWSRPNGWMQWCLRQ